MNVERIYRYALQRELEGKLFFETSAGRMSHAAASNIMLRLAAEEEKHIRFIEGLLEAQSGEGQAALGDIGFDQDAPFSRRAESEMIDQTVIESMVPDVSILRMAYLIERDFAEYYEMASESAEGDAREALAVLGRWERGHERLFKDLHDRVFQEYAGMPWGG